MGTLESNSYDSNYNLFLQLYLPAELNRNYRIIVSARTEPELSRDSLNVYTQLLIQWSSQHNYADKIMCIYIIYFQLKLVTVLNLLRILERNV